MNITRVDTPTGGSRVEPPLEQGWDNATKLQWKAAVVAHDTGLNVRVDESDYRKGLRRLRGYYDIRVEGSISFPFTFDGAWDFLNGVNSGADAMRDMLEEA